MKNIKYIILSIALLDYTASAETQLFSLDGEAVNDMAVGMIVGSVFGGGGGMWAVTMVGGGFLGYMIGAPDRQSEKQIRNDPKNNKVVDTKNFHKKYEK